MLDPPIDSCLYGLVLVCILRFLFIWVGSGLYWKVLVYMVWFWFVLEGSCLYGLVLVCIEWFLFIWVGSSLHKMVLVYMGWF